MTFPRETLTVLDPGLGVSAPSANTPVFTGKSFGGSAALNTIVSVGQLSQVRSILGYGPLAEDVALCLQRSGSPVLAVLHSDATSSITGNMTKSGTGPDIALSGVPRDTYAMRVTIIKGGALGTAQFQYTLDDFDENFASPSLSQIRTIPSGGGGAFLVPNTGITLTFAAGTYVMGDTYTYASLAPEVTPTDLATVATLLEGDATRVFYLWLLSGAKLSATTAATLAAAFEGALDALTGSYRYVRGFIDVGSGDTSANVHTSALTWTGIRTAPDYGYELIASAVPYEGFSTRKTSCVSSAAVRAAGSLISTDLSRVASGPAEGVIKIYFDESNDQTLDSDKIGGMRTFVGMPGFYIANAPLKSPFGSDFTDLQFGRVMDVACRTTYAALFPYISESLRTTLSGTIDPRDAAMIEASVNSALRDALLNPLNARGNPGHVSDCKYSVDQTVNLNTTQTLVGTVGIRPLGYSKIIATTLFFTLTP